jgi:dTDP-4-amino-4,6-dideoxygalactose transaminase
MLNRAKPYIDLSRIIHELHFSDTASDEHVEKYEDRISKKIGVPYCVAVDQGRVALLMALRILDAKRGDEVIVQSFICEVVIDAISEVGATPVLVDSSIGDFNISAEEVAKKITRKTKVIIAAHLYGTPCDIGEIANIAEENDCYLIEDCAHTMSAKYAGRNVGAFGDMAFFSTNFDKPYSTGQGGVLAVTNERLLDRAKKVVNQCGRASLEKEKTIVYGMLIQHLLTQKNVYCAWVSMDYGVKLVREDRQLFELVDRLVLDNASESRFTEETRQYLAESPELRRQILAERLKSTTPPSILHGLKLAREQIDIRGARVHEIHGKDLLMGPFRAIVGNICLDSLAQVDGHRSEVAKSLQKRLAGLNCYKLPTISHRKEPTFLRYSILNRTRHSLSQISRCARKEGLEIGNYNWAKPVHLIHRYKAIFGNAKELKTSELIANNVLNLPVHYYVDERDVDAIVGVLTEFDRD